MWAAWREQNWFTNPAGWARGCLSKRSVYLQFQGLCVAGAVFCSAAVYLPASRLGLGLSTTWGLYVLAVVFGGVLPLIYLRAARALVISQATPPPSGSSPG